MTESTVAPVKSFAPRDSASGNAVIISVVFEPTLQPVTQFPHIVHADCAIPAAFPSDAVNATVSGAGSHRAPIALARRDSAPYLLVLGLSLRSTPSRALASSNPSSSSPSLRIS